MVLLSLLSRRPGGINVGAIPLGPAEPGDKSSVQLVYTLGDILQRQEWLKQQPWARKALELETMEGGFGLVLSLIDKFLCVEARHFFGAQGSTFSAEINWFLRPAERR